MSDSDEAFVRLLGEVAAAPPLIVSSLMVGSTLSRYRIDAEIARGGFGVVFKAHDPSLNRPVALKVFYAPSREKRDEHEREARQLATFQHPNIAAVYDVGHQEGLSYLALEYLPGQTLRQRIHAGTVEPGPTLDGIVRGLAAAHDKGLVHRDVKPENVLFAADGTAKLVDFGLAHDEGLRDERGTGTRGYVAPEVRAGQPITAAADVYAVGVLIDELYSGRPPRALAQLAAQCRQPAAARPPDGAALVRALAQGPRRGVLAAVAAAAAVLVAALVFSLARLDPEPPALTSIPRVTEDVRAQRAFAAATQAFFNADDASAARILDEIWPALPAWPVAAVRLSVSPFDIETDRRQALLDVLARTGAEDPFAHLLARLVARRLRALEASDPAPDPGLARAVEAARRAHTDDFFRAALLAIWAPTDEATDRAQALRALSDIDPRPALPYVYEAYAWQREGALDEAGAALQAGLAHNPHNRRLRTEWARHRLATGETDDARRALDGLVRQYPDDVLLRFDQAEAAFYAGDEDTWRRVLDDVLSGPYPRGLAGRGVLFHLGLLTTRGRFAEALPWLDRTLAMLDDAGQLDTYAAGLDRVAKDAARTEDATLCTDVRRRLDDARARTGLPPRWRQLLELDAHYLDGVRAATTGQGVAESLTAMTRLGVDGVPPVTAEVMRAHVRLVEAEAQGRPEQAKVAAQTLATVPRWGDVAKARAARLQGAGLVARGGLEKVLDEGAGCLAERLMFRLRCRIDLAWAASLLVSLDETDADRRTHRRAFASIWPRADPGLLLTKRAGTAR